MKSETDHLGNYCVNTEPNVQIGMFEIENACGNVGRPPILTVLHSYVLTFLRSYGLTFLRSFFLVKQKVEEENMNGRLYDSRYYTIFPSLIVIILSILRKVSSRWAIIITV
jgi:hypothetical protein